MKKYEIVGMFNTGDKFGNDASNLKELKFLCDQIIRNECITSFKIMSKGQNITDEIMRRFYNR